MIEEICEQINEALKHGIRNEDLRLFVTHDVYEALKKEIGDRAVYFGDFPPCWLELYRGYKSGGPRVYTIYGVEICPAQWGTGWALAETQRATAKPLTLEERVDRLEKTFPKILGL